MSVSCECCVLSGGGLPDGLIANREVSTECGVSECGREASVRRPWSTRGCCAMGGGGGETGLIMFLYHIYALVSIYTVL